MANTVRILITAKDEISGQLDKIRDKASLLSKTDIGKGMAMGAGIAGFNMLKGAAMGALDAVTDYVGGSVAAFREEEVGIARLGSSLRANVKDWDGNTDAIERQIGAMVKTTGFSDSEMRASLARLVAATKDVGKAFDIQRTAMDLARFKGISLADASDALIKVEAGQYRALKGLGIVLREGATQTEALAAVQKVAGGQMAAYAETAAGKTEILNKRLGDMQEELGAKLSPVLESATDGLLKLADAAEIAWETIDRAAPTGWADDVAHDLGPEGNIFAAVGNLLDLVGSVPDKFRLAFDTENITRESLNAYRASERLGESYEGLTGKAPKAADAVGEVGDAAKATTPRVSKMRDLVLDLGGAYKDLDKWASEAAETLLQNDPKQLTLAYEGSVLALKDEKSELKDVQAEIEKRHKKGLHATREQRIDENRLKQSIEETKDETVTLGLKLAASGKITYADLRKELAKLGIVLDAETDKAMQLAFYLDKAGHKGRSFGQSGRTTRDDHRAAGGPVAPYESVTVGEYRPETIRMGAIGGMVSPTVGGGTGGGGVSVSINVSTPVMTPGAAQALADAIAPHITRWQQARGV